MSTIDLIGKLEGARQSTAPDQWIARCPAHDDKRPSLSVHRADDGRWLINCFAGCSAVDICAALGIGLSDLFPDGPVGNRQGGLKHALTAAERLELIDHEVTVIVLLATRLIEAQRVDEQSWARLAQARARIGKARHV